MADTVIVPISPLADASTRPRNSASDSIPSICVSSVSHESSLGIWFSASHSRRSACGVSSTAEPNTAKTVIVSSVPAVRLLAARGAAITLVTFEKEADLRDVTAVANLEGDLSRAGVSWEPLRYHKTPKWPATLLDAFLALLQALRVRMRGRFDIVHARTFVSGPMGFVIARLLGARFVYHNEGFYPDEQVDGGVWRRGSFVHRLARGVEDFLYRNADGLVVLSDRARQDVVRRLGGHPIPPIIVVPSAVDLAAFQPGDDRNATSGPLSLVYLGSVGLRYRLDDAGRFVTAVRRLRPGSTLTVVSRADPQLVESMLDAAGLPREAWSRKELPHADVPAELVRHDAGLFFLTEGLSEHGCSPTKIGEYWACGLPVVTTPNVSDTDRIVKEQRVGVVVTSKDGAARDHAARALVELVGDPETKARCRKAAETAYALDASCQRQMRLYAELAP